MSVWALVYAAPDLTRALCLMIPKRTPPAIKITITATAMMPLVVMKKDGLATICPGSPSETAGGSSAARSSIPGGVCNPFSLPTPRVLTATVSLASSPMGAITSWPHWLQNREPSETSAPQAGHVAIPTRPLSYQIFV